MKYWWRVDEVLINGEKYLFFIYFSFILENVTFWQGAPNFSHNNKGRQPMRWIVDMKKKFDNIVMFIWNLLSGTGWFEQFSKP